MKRSELLAQAKTPAGATITLTLEADSYVVRVAGSMLMSSRMSGSEEVMAQLACAPLMERRVARPRVLVGGLGLGFTLRATLDALGPDAEVVVSELLPCLVEWNRGPLAHLASAPLDDPRATLSIGDLGALLRRATPRSYDALLLDVDNGPEAFTVPSNDWLYGPGGLAAARASLRPGGMLVVWSAFQAPPFERALRAAGFRPEVVPVRARGAIKKGSRHFLYVGHVGSAAKRRA
ncbi:MAG: hypothetical protein KF901_25400 [Myxococcales bacterium]|nr:hypothetical protein [Myxococcales bacterium]